MARGISLVTVKGSRYGYFSAIQSGAWFRKVFLLFLTGQWRLPGKVVFSPQMLYFAVAEFSEFFIWHLPLLPILGTFSFPYPQCYFPAQFGFST